MHADALAFRDRDQRARARRHPSWCRSDWPGSPPSRRRAASCGARRSAPWPTAPSASAAEVSISTGSQPSALRDVADKADSRAWRSRPGRPARTCARNARMKPAEEPVVTTTRAGSSVERHSARHNGAAMRAAKRRDAERFGISRCGRRRARPAPPRSPWSARAPPAGRSPCGSTRRPAASSRAAAAITSMTMNGGTSLRTDDFTVHLIRSFAGHFVRSIMPFHMAPVLAPFSPYFEPCYPAGTSASLTVLDRVRSLTRRNRARF